MRGSINIKYRENDINGIIRKIAKNTKSQNIYKDGFISFYSSTFNRNGCYDVLTGVKECATKNKWFTTAGNDKDPWIIIDFHSSKLTIEGFVINTGGVDYLPCYKLYVSNDNETWEEVGNKTFDSMPDGSIHSFETKKKEARFIKLNGFEQRFGGGDLRMVLYQIDLFGKLSVVSPIRQSCQVRRKPQIFSLMLNEIFFIT